MKSGKKDVFNKDFQEDKMSKGRLLSIAFEAAAKGKDVSIRMSGEEFKELAIALYTGGYTEINLFELFKNASAQIIAKEKEQCKSQSLEYAHSC